MRAPEQEWIATAGQSAVKSDFERLRWGAIENAYHDLGTDLWLMCRDDRRFDLGLLVGVQVKTSEKADKSSKYFKSPSRNNEGDVDGWWYYEEDCDHFKYWLQHSIPHIIVLHDLEARMSYWVQLTTDSVSWTTRGAKIRVPKIQIVDRTNTDDLIKVATSGRPAPIWEGSAWTANHNIAPDDSLRYALITPRLIAPHPNTSVIKGTPAQALAMLTQGRIRELTHHQVFKAIFKGGDQPWPTTDEARSSRDRAWHLYAALFDYLNTGQHEALIALAGEEGQPHERTVSAVVAASALLEESLAEDALQILDTALKIDRAHPVDHAWLQIQKARCLTELGRKQEARNLAIGIQGLRFTAPFDPTATAIAAVGAKLVFSTAELGTADIQAVITSSDTTAEWWRSQTISSGLDAFLDDGFDRWSQNKSVTIGFENTTFRHLRSASLMSGFTGDQMAWRQAMSRLTKFLFTSVTPNSPKDFVAGLLTNIRRCGDSESLKLAITHLIRVGPAYSVRDASEPIDLEISTRTTAGADITFITYAADVLSTPTADQHAQWALQFLNLADDLIENTADHYYKIISVLDMLASLVIAVSPNIRREIIDHVVMLKTQTNEVIAHRYAKLVQSIDRNAWSNDDRVRLANSLTDHHSALDDAFTALLTDRDASVRDQVIAELRSGSVHALTRISDFSGLPHDASAAVINTLSTEIRNLIATNHKWSWPCFLVDKGAALTIFNSIYPESANWVPLLEFLAAPFSRPQDLTGVLRQLVRYVERIPDRICTNLIPLARQLMQPTEIHQHLGSTEELVGLATELLDTLSPGTVTSTELWALMRGGVEEQRSLIRIISRRGDSSQVGFLAAIAVNENNMARATAAYYVALWAANGIAAPDSSALTMQLLDDPGTALASNIVIALQDSTSPIPPNFISKLRDHISADVRHGVNRLQHSDN